MDNIGVTLQFKTKALGVALEPVSQGVLRHFRLPTLRLLCFFDDADLPCFAQRFGTKYRGFHTPVQGSGYMPDYVSRHFFTAGGFAFDNIVYLRGSTCASQEGAVITLMIGIDEPATRTPAPLRRTGAWMDRLRLSPCVLVPMDAAMVQHSERGQIRNHGPAGLFLERLGAFRVDLGRRAVTSAAPHGLRVGSLAMARISSTHTQIAD